MIMSEINHEVSLSMEHVKGLFLGSALLFMLSGCVSQAELMQGYKVKCQSFGYVEGTPQFSQCIEKQDLEGQRDSAIIDSSQLNWGPGWGGWGAAW